MPSVSMGEICNPCAVQVTSKLTFVGNGAFSQPTNAMDLFLFFFPPTPPCSPDYCLHNVWTNSCCMVYMGVVFWKLGVGRELRMT